jgi:Mn-containing catalase
MELRIVLFFFSFLLSACVQMKSQPKYIEKMNEELGKNVQRLESPAGTYTLFYSMDTVSEAQQSVKFMVVENETDQLIFQDALANVRLSWYSDSLLLVEQQLGILQKEMSENGMRRFLLDPTNGRKNIIPQNKNSQ